MTIHAPLIDWSKLQIIQRGLELGVDYAMTHSCYDPSETGVACARCDACLLRQSAFEQLGMTDPLLEVRRTAEQQENRKAEHGDG